MSKSYFSQFVFTHKSALVYITVNAVYASFSCILPKHEVEVVFQYRYALGILSYHNLIVVELAKKVAVVEVGSCIDKRLLTISFLYEMKEFEQRIAKLLGTESALCLNIYHRQQILVGWSALGHKVVELHLLRYSWTIEVV